MSWEVSAGTVDSAKSHIGVWTVPIGGDECYRLCVHVSDGVNPPVASSKKQCRDYQKSCHSSPEPTGTGREWYSFPRVSFRWGATTAEAENDEQPVHMVYMWMRSLWTNMR